MPDAATVMNRRLGLLALLLVPLGVATKLYAGPAEFWVRAHAGGVLYVMFWCWTLLALRPHWPARTVAAVVLAATCVLEFMQLWHPAPLQAVRATALGHALLGSAFSWSDFPHYLLGAVLAAWIARRLDDSRTGAT